MEHYIPLKVEFYLYENILCGKILQQDERMIKYVDDEDVIISYEEYKIKIMNNPELNKNTLYLRGIDKETDNHVFYYKYANKDKAKKALNNFKDLIRTLNNYYKDDQEPKVEICE